MHKASRRVTDLLKEHKISELVIGYNQQWKQEINLGKRNNQTFNAIPHHAFVAQLRYKCQLMGIKVSVQEESYTSKCSALDLEPVQKQGNYVGRRVNRGLFRSKEGLHLNAYVNGSLNIGRKAFGDEYAQYYIANRGYGQYPIRLKPGK
jgi:putative transposase